MLSVENLVDMYLFFMYVMCIMLFFSPCSLRFFVCTPGTAALWRRRPERPNRGRVSFTQTLLDKPCANGTVAGTYMGNTSVTAHFFPPTILVTLSWVSSYAQEWIFVGRKAERRNCGRVSCHTAFQQSSPLSLSGPTLA